MTTNDSGVLKSPFIIANHLKGVLGDGWEVLLLSDLVSDCIPTHIVGCKVFLAHRGDERLIVKLGKLNELEHEKAILLDLQQLTQIKLPTITGEGLQLPIPYFVRDLGFNDLSLLALSFHGIHTLEHYRIQGQSDVTMAALLRVARTLADLDVVWPSLMTRNVVINENSHGAAVLCPVDWELGYLSVSSAQSNSDFYIRSIELLEENCTFTADLLSYWCDGWPAPSELVESTSSHFLYSSVSLEHHRDIRIAPLKSILNLPDRVTDAQYFRLILVLCSLCERSPNLYSPLYGADHLSEYANQSTRAGWTVLAWYLETSGHMDLLKLLHENLALTAHRLFCIWRGAYDLELLDLWIAKLLAELNYAVTSIGSIAYGRDSWRDAVVDTCRTFIMQGEPEVRIQFNVLHTLRGMDK